MAYNDLQFAKPDGADDGPTVVDDILRNLLALTDYAQTLIGKGWLVSITNGSGDARRPQYVTLKSASNERWLRATIAWGTSAGEKYNPTSVLWEMSANSGSLWDTVETWATTYDANGNPTATTGGGGMSVFLFAMLGHFWRHVDTYTTHAASTTAHGIGSIASQAANAAALAGTTTVIGKFSRGTRVADLGSKSGAFDVDLGAGEYFSCTVTGSGAAASFINASSSTYVSPFALRVTNGGVATSPATLFPGASIPTGLTLQASGVDMVFGLVMDGDVYITGAAQDLN